jgi:hypothetical protein
MEPACSSGISGVEFQRSTRRHVSEDAVKTPNPTFVRQFVEVFVFQGMKVERCTSFSTDPQYQRKSSQQICGLLENVFNIKLNY